MFTSRVKNGVTPTDELLFSGLSLHWDHFDFNLESGWCDLVASYQISRRILKAGLSFSPVIGFVLGLTKSYGEAVALLRICAPGNWEVNFNAQR